MYKKQFDDLLKKHGKEELVNSLVFPVKLTAKQKTESYQTLQAELAKSRAAMSPGDKVKANLLQLRFQIDDYINDKKFDKNKTFGYFLKTYIEGLEMKRKDFAGEINIKETELSQYINNHRTPPQNVIIRLELHSRKTISAVNWYRLIEKKTVHELGSNTALRTAQKRFVKSLS